MEDVRNACIIREASNESYLPAPPPPPLPDLKVTGRYAVEEELQRWMLKTGGACLDMCWPRSRKECKWGCDCKYLHYVDRGSEKHMIEEATRMKRMGVERYIWRWKDTRNKYNDWKQKQMAKQSEASIAISQKVYREAPPEHRFEASR